MVNAPADRIFKIVSNFEFRYKMFDDLRKIEYEPNEVNRVGTKHVCVYDSGNLELETVTANFGETKKVYGEKLMTLPPFVKELVTYHGSFTL